ncbi:hypothetical protein TNCV_1967421 [Trichonephila clavipes]|nr:hypothetical protein TNCV_1967421 [Trichonephila clavipes]
MVDLRRFSYGWRNLLNSHSPRIYPPKNIPPEYSGMRKMIRGWLSAKPKNSKTFHPDEEPLPRLPDSIARPIAIMPLSRMENTNFAMPSIIDSHDMGLRTVYSPDTQKKTPIQRLF